MSIDASKRKPGRQPIVTEQSYCVAVKNLHSRGISNPTMRQIRDEIGGGSMSTICSFSSQAKMNKFGCKAKKTTRTSAKLPNKNSTTDNLEINRLYKRIEKYEAILDKLK